MIILVWNVQGAESSKFFQVLLEHIRINKPTMVVLLEMKISSFNADDVCDKLGFNGVIQVEAKGYNRGIWMLWHLANVAITPLFIHSQHITVKVKESLNPEWCFFAIYGCPI